MATAFIVRFLRIFAFGVFLGTATLGAHAQSYPVKPLRLIVPLAPGGPSDILARTMAAQLTPGLGQSVPMRPRPIP